MVLKKTNSLAAGLSRRKGVYVLLVTKKLADITVLCDV